MIGPAELIIVILSLGLLLLPIFLVYRTLKRMALKNTLEGKLKELEELKTKGIINEQEYSSKRAQLLNNF